MVIKKPWRYPFFGDYARRNIYQSPQVHGGGSRSRGAAALGAHYLGEMASPADVVHAQNKLNVASKSPFSTTEKETPFNDITNYNNFYEFSTDKYEPAKLAQALKTRPWTVQVDGLVKKPQDLRHRLLPQDLPDRRAHLPSSLRRRLVDGHPLERFRAQQLSSKRWNRRAKPST